MSNVYLQGNFAPIDSELTIDKLTVVGEIPADLNGCYLRNGPNPAHEPIGHYHWFDGDGMVHGIQLRNGQASYLNRYVNTSCLEKERQAGRSIWTGLTGRPNLRQWLVPPFGIRQKNPANTGLVWHAGKLLALWEVGMPYQLTVPDLKTHGPVDYGLPVKAVTAHPKIDSQRNEMRFFGMNFGHHPALQYGVVDLHGTLAHHSTIPLGQNSFMHDFAITNNYTIFLDLPYTFSLKAMLTKGTPFAFDNTKASRFGVMPRCGIADDIVWFEDDPCFIYHTLNAYETIDSTNHTTITMQACRLPKGTIGIDNEPAMGNDDVGHLHQWQFDLNRRKVTSEPLDDRPCDLPRVNDRYLSSNARYGYASVVTMEDANHGSPLFTGITKYDLFKRESTEYSFGHHVFGGESVFAPRSPVACEEDDGWLLNIVYDAQTGKSQLLIIDAANFDAGPVARVLIPQRVPYGFHGTWVAASQI